jgi:RND family efflux transporter MFP subunit
MSKTPLLLACSLALSCAGPALQPDEPPPSPESPRPLAVGPDPVPGSEGFVGVAIAREAVNLGAGVSGTLVAARARLGQVVEAGELLALIEVPTLPAEIEAAEAALRAGEAEWSEQRLVLAHARRQLAHERTLTAAGARAPSEREQAEFTLARAEATERRVAAQLAERRAELHRLQRQREAGRVLAPFRGVVAGWFHPEGAVLDSGAPTVRLVATDRLWVRFAVPVDTLPQAQPGAAIEVTPVPAAAPLHGVIRHVAPELDLASQLMLVEAELTDDVGLVAGQACRVALSGTPSGQIPE